MAAGAALAGLFGAAVLAGSILPAGSEAVLAGLLVTQAAPPLTLLIVATAGNVLGAALNYGLGRAAETLRHRRWFPLSPAQWERRAAQFRRWGVLSLLLSWVPIIGDGFTVLAGAARTPVWLFLALVTIAKGGRYWLIVSAFSAA